MPLTNAVGTNTAHSTRATAMTGPLTSFMAFFVASTGARPSAMLRSTFSTTTMASSTTMPMASTRPNSERLFREKPNTFITANVPMRDPRTASSGMREARHVADARDLTLHPLFDDDVAELLLIEQTALRADRELKILTRGDGRLANRAGGHLKVLLADGADDITGRHVA